MITHARLSDKYFCVVRFAREALAGLGDENASLSINYSVD